MTFKAIIPVFICFFLFQNLAQAQTLDSAKLLLCRKWLPEKYKEADGKIYPVPKEAKEQYLLYRKDGTMESIEDNNLKINGQWTLDEKAKTLTTIQTQTKEYPQRVVGKLIKLTATSLVIQSKDARGSLVTIYFIPAKE